MIVRTKPGLQTRIDALTPKQRLALELLLDRNQQPVPTSSRKKLCAYIVPAKDQFIDRSEIRDWLRNQLPDYMVPESITEIDALPRTTNGKLDTNQLPTPEPDSSPNNEVTEPRNESEQTLAKIWRNLLGLDVVSVHDDFFEVGGDSIVSIQVMSRARQAGILLEPQHFAEVPTIAGLAKAGTAIKEIGSVLKERDSDGATTQPSAKQFIFRLDGIGNTIQYFEVELNHSLPVIKPAQIIRFDQKYFRGTTLGEMATDYLTAIRKVQPNGPYMFVSMDCGAHVTYETAQQLLRLGEEVSFFGAVESAPPLLATSVSRKYLIKGLRYIRRGNLKGLIQGLRLTARRRTILRPTTPKKTPTSELFNHGLTINNYLPALYPGKITVFQSSAFHKQKHGDENIRQWNALTHGEVDVHIVLGGMPFDVFAADYVQQLAHCLPLKAPTSTEIGK